LDHKSLLNRNVEDQTAFTICW